VTPGPGEAGRGAGNGSSSGEFDAFLAALAGVVAERVQALGSKPVAKADPVFFDESKTIIEWPELSAYVIEELR
jgi:hypothetical protein